MHVVELPPQPLHGNCHSYHDAILYWRPQHGDQFSCALLESLQKHWINSYSIDAVHRPPLVDLLR